MPPPPNKSTTERVALYHAWRQRTQTEAAAAAIPVLIAVAAAADANRKTKDMATHKATAKRAVERTQAHKRHQQRLIKSVLEHHRIRLRPGLHSATTQHSTHPNSGVSFLQPVVTHTLVYKTTKPAATIGPSLYTDSGCLVIIVTEMLANEANLFHLGFSKTRVKTANGGIIKAKEVTKIP